MDPILSAKSNSMADAFSMLLAIQQGPKGPVNGRIHRRMMRHNHYPFFQFIFHEKENEGPKHNAQRWVSAEFRQWDGFFYLYYHTTEAMKPYLPHKKGHVQQGFNFARFTEESPARLYTLDQIDEAARDALNYLVNGIEAPVLSPAQQQATLKRIMNFKNFHRTSGKVYLNISDLGSLLEK
jgi:hypothetical protein